MLNESMFKTNKIRYRPACVITTSVSRTAKYVIRNGEKFVVNQPAIY